MRTHGEDCSPTGTWADTNWWVCRCPTHHPHKPWWNRADSVLCEFSGCNTARPEQKPQQTASTAVSLEEKKWRCPSCSLVNPIREFYCTRCRLHHPSRRLPKHEWECTQCKRRNAPTNHMCYWCECVQF